MKLTFCCHFDVGCEMTVFGSVPNKEKSLLQCFLGMFSLRIMRISNIEEKYQSFDFNLICKPTYCRQHTLCVCIWYYVYAQRLICQRFLHFSLFDV